MSGKISPFNSSPTTSFLPLASTPGEDVRSGEPKTMADAAETINSIAKKALPDFLDFNPKEFDPEVFHHLLTNQETPLEVPGTTPCPNTPASKDFAIHAQKAQKPGPKRPNPKTKKQQTWRELMSTLSPEAAAKRKARKYASNLRWQKANRIRPQKKVALLEARLSQLQEKRDALQAQLATLEERKVTLFEAKLSQLQESFPCAPTPSIGKA